MKLKELTSEQKAAILDGFIDYVAGINAKYGTVMGTIQIMHKLEEIAVINGFEKCPHCGRTA